jgi:isopentenyl phosphate kinase
LEARKLNEHVISSFSSAGLPIIAFPPSANIFTKNGHIQNWELQPLKNSLSSGLIPVINGDVIFDDFLGGTILSTEELFAYLTPILKPDRILLVGIEDGVWEDFPSRKKRIPKITPEIFPTVERHLGQSNAVDVTGGMANKVKDMLKLVQANAELEIMLFSGAKPGSVLYALSGNTVGTVVCRSE